MQNYRREALNILLHVLLFYDLSMIWKMLRRINYSKLCFAQTLVFNCFVDTPPSGELPSRGGEIITNRCLSVNFPTFLLVDSHDRKGPNKHFWFLFICKLMGIKKHTTDLFNGKWFVSHCPSLKLSYNYHMASKQARLWIQCVFFIEQFLCMSCFFLCLTTTQVETQTTCEQLSQRMHS